MSNDRQSRPVFGERGNKEQLPFGAYKPRTDTPLRETYREPDPAPIDASYMPPPRRANGSTADVTDQAVERVRRTHYAPEPDAAPSIPRFIPRPLHRFIPRSLYPYLRPRPMAIAGSVMFGIVVVAIAASMIQPRSDDSHTISNIAEINTPLPTTPTATALHNPQIVPAHHNRIGIASGHRGINPENGLPDPGAVCEDGLTEQSVVENISFRVAELLQAEGYAVDILDKWDERLPGYSAQALVSIHADSCDYINDLATGFKVASYALTSMPEADAKLVNCLNTHYEAATGLAQHPGSITPAMTENYVFRLMSPEVPAAIIEVGFLYLDREVITTRGYDAAYGIAQGILCYFAP